MKPIYVAGPSITDHERKVVAEAMQTGWYEKPYYYCEEFQKEFARYHDRKFAVMTPNCTTSIHLLLTCLGVGEGDEVIAPDCTWIASVAPITYLKAVPIFCDISEDDWCLDPVSLESCITSKTKAIIAVDLFGNMPKMDEIRAIAEKHGIPLIEDAAEALGSTYKGTKAGKFGRASVFSFHRTKTLTTGEGGMLLTDDEELYNRCMVWRDHGRRPGGALYYNYEVTYKYMPFNLQAALGYAQFQRVDELVAIKRWHLRMYKELLAGVEDITFNAEPAHVVNGAWITGLVFGKSHRLEKGRAIEELAKLGVPARPFFYPLSSLPAFPGLLDKYSQRNKNAYDISARGINLPGAMNLEEEQLVFICEGIKKILGVA